MNIKTFAIVALGFLSMPQALHSQDVERNDVLVNATLPELLQYALDNRPGVRQALLDEQIGEREIKSALSGWLPQVGASGTFDHNLKQQVSPLTVGDETSYITLGTKNASSVSLRADQRILDAGLIQASKSAKYYREQYDLGTEDSKINTVVEVSKAYYDILTSHEQIRIIIDNIARIEKQFADAKARYDVGLVDKTDFQRAQISVSNSKADLKRASEMLKYKYAYLKSLIGFNSKGELRLSFEGRQMESGALIDTTEVLDYGKRVEYRQLQTQKRLLEVNTLYNKLQFLPTLSAFYNYSLQYNEDDFSQLYNQSFPGSVVGLRLSLPIFSGTRRIQEIRKAQLLEERLELDLEDARNQIGSQYERAMAAYKASLNDWSTAKENARLSEEVYKIIKLQYDEGLRAYLDLMTSEIDLRTAQLNYLNTLYNLLAAKLDVQQAMGTISINQQ